MFAHLKKKKKKNSLESKHQALLEASFLYKITCKCVKQMSKKTLWLVLLTGAQSPGALNKVFWVAKFFAAVLNTSHVWLLNSQLLAWASSIFSQAIALIVRVNREAVTSPK